MQPLIRQQSGENPLALLVCRLTNVTVRAQR